VLPGATLPLFPFSGCACWRWFFGRCSCRLAAPRPPASSRPTRGKAAVVSGGATPPPPPRLSSPTTVQHRSSGTAFALVFSFFYLVSSRARLTPILSPAFPALCRPIYGGRRWGRTSMTAGGARLSLNVLMGMAGQKQVSSVKRICPQTLPKRNGWGVRRWRGGSDVASNEAGTEQEGCFRETDGGAAVVAVWAPRTECKSLRSACTNSFFTTYMQTDDMNSPPTGCFYPLSHPQEAHRGGKNEPYSIDIQRLCGALQACHRVRVHPSKIFPAAQ